MSASSRAALANDMRNERMKEAAPEMYAELRRVAGWLDRLAAQAETQAKDLRFTSLAEACAADAKNYRKTRDIIMSLINKVDGKI